MSERVPAIKEKILASAVEARKTATHRYVTKAMNAVRVGRTSITAKVLVEAERWGAGHGERVKVTEAEVVLVAIGPDGTPVTVLRA